MSNTDLKLEYGRNHLDEMQAIGENYVQLSILIVTIAEILYEAGEYNDAARILEYGIATKTDINKNYMLLADCYNMLGSTRQLTELGNRFLPWVLLGRNILSHIDDLIKSSSSTPSENFPTEN